MSSNPSPKPFVSAFDKLAWRIAECNRLRGWNTKESNPCELIALMHAELSEAVEWLRAGDLESDHIAGFSGVTEELADTVIRILAFCESRKLPIASAILAKVAFNESREYQLSLATPAEKVRLRRNDQFRPVRSG
jgi:NTP pyrophosphatase (non-canonical NTP hydrolase)